MWKHVQYEKWHFFVFDMARWMKSELIFMIRYLTRIITPLLLIRYILSATKNLKQNVFIAQGVLIFKLLEKIVLFRLIVWSSQKSVYADRSSPFGDPCYRMYSSILFTQAIIYDVCWYHNIITFGLQHRNVDTGRSILYTDTLILLLHAKY